MKQLRILLVAFLMIMGSSIYAQTGLKLDTESSKVTVLGTSTLHDWEMDAEQVSGDLKLDGDQIQSLNFNCVVEGIKSGKSKMDKLAYEALNSDDSPNITFDLTLIFTPVKWLYRSQAQPTGSSTGKLSTYPPSVRLVFSRLEGFSHAE